MQPDAVDRFLIACLRGQWDSPQADAPPDAAWTAVDQRAGQEGLRPLLFSLLRGSPHVPPDVLSRWRQAYEYTAVRNTYLLHRLAQLTERLSQASIPFICLKGSALAEPFYGSVALRPMSDLDLLVRHADIPRILPQTTALHYQPVQPEVYAGLTLDYENELQIAADGPFRTLVELHWSLFDAPHYQQRLDMDWFWHTAVTMPINGCPTRTLGPEAQLLHLSAHMVLHHTGRELLWLNDIALLLHHKQDALDWDLVLARATAFDLLIPLQRLLPALADEWGVPVPTAVLNQLAARTPSPAEQALVAELAMPDRPVIRRFWTDLKGLPGWRRRADYALRQMFPSQAYMRERYAIAHPLLLPLAYPYRWALGFVGLFARPRPSAPHTQQG